MKTKALFTSLLLLMAFSLYAQETTSEPVKRYGFKSAIAKVSTDVMGQKVESTAYIDDYGAKECQKTKVTVPGVGEVESASIVKDGKSWAVNYMYKQIQETTESLAGQPNFLNLDEETIKKFNIKEAGKGTILDKECTIYTMENEVQVMKAEMKVWVYKGLAMKSETNISGMKLVGEMVEFEEGAMVLPQVFDLPKF